MSINDNTDNEGIVKIKTKTSLLATSGSKRNSRTTSQKEVVTRKKSQKFDNLDRETQMKILSSEKKLIKLGLKDFIQKKENDVNSELDPFLSKGAGDTPTHKPHLVDKLIRTGSLKLKKNNPLGVPKKAKFKRNSFHSRSKSFTEDFNYSPPPEKKSNLSLFGNAQNSRNYKLEVEEDGLKLKIPQKEKLLLKKTLISNNASDEEEETPKPEIRELIRMKQVYDSCSDEELEIEDDGAFVIYPKSYFKYIWDFFIFVFSLISLVLSPLSIAFDAKEKTVFLIDAVFFVDLLLNFWMGFYDNEENLILNEKKIILNYVFGWFWIDLLSCIPFNTLKNLDNLPLRLYYLCLLRLLKNYKLENSTNVFYFKIIKKVLCFSSREKRFFRQYFVIPAGAKSLISNILRFVSIVHILSCVWIYLARMRPGDNWTNNLSESEKYEKHKLYLTSFYFNMVSVLTLGYGDILTVSFLERCYSLFLLVISLGINTYAMSFLENLADLGNQKNAKLEQKKEFLENIAINYHVSYELYEKILNFLKYTYQFKADEKEKFIDYLPTSLKNTLICSMYRDIINNFIFFKMHRDDNVEFKSRVLLSLRPIVAYKGEEVIKIGEFVDELVFVKSGQLSMFIRYLKYRVRLLYLRRNEHFGEILILSRERSPVGLKVITSRNTELLLLRKNDFFSIMNDFKDIFTGIINRSRENMKRINKVIIKKKIQIKRMISQTKLFRENSSNLKLGNTNSLVAKRNQLLQNNTLDQIKNLSIFGDKFKSNSQEDNSLVQNSFGQNKNENSENTSFNENTGKSSKDTNKLLNITLNVTNDPQKSPNQNVFINLNSTNPQAFKRLKEIKVTINNENKDTNGKEVNDKKKSTFHSEHSDNHSKDFHSFIKKSVVEPIHHQQELLRFQKSIQLSKGKLPETVSPFHFSETKSKKKLNIDAKEENPMIDFDENNRAKRVSMKLLSVIKKKIDDKSEEMKLNLRLSNILKTYFNYDSSKDEKDSEY